MVAVFTFDAIHTVGVGWRDIALHTIPTECSISMQVAASAIQTIDILYHFVIDEIIVQFTHISTIKKTWSHNFNCVIAIRTQCHAVAIQYSNLLCFLIALDYTINAASTYACSIVFYEPCVWTHIMAYLNRDLIFI